MNLGNLAKAKVLVIGDVMLDQYWLGETSRISPEAPVPVINIEDMENRLGGAANVAANAISVGAAVTLVGMVGHDENGKRLLELLDATDIDTRITRKENYRTSTKLRVVSRNQQLLRLDHENSREETDNTEVLEICEQQISKHGTIVISDYDKGAVAGIERIIEAARKAGKRTVVDPKGASFDKYKNASIITPNYQEFRQVAGECRDEEELENKALRMCKELNLDALLITRSEHGMSLFAQDQPARHFPTQAREVYDVTGAGDTVVGLFASALSADYPIADAVKIANLGAGVAVSRLGTVAVTAEDLSFSLQATLTRGKRVTDLDELKRAVAAKRRNNEKIVFTNGCFDLIHRGHIACLRDAKSRGDHLIVAINDDTSVKSIKGNGRPVCSLQNRIEVLEELSCIDWLIPFSEDTPLTLIEELKPDVYVKGGDYEKEKLAEYELVSSYGGEVVISPYVEGCSTTSIIDSISNA